MYVFDNERNILIVHMSYIICLGLPRWLSKRVYQFLENSGIKMLTI